MPNICPSCGEGMPILATVHLCDPTKKKNHAMAAARRVLLDFGTIGEKIFYKNFFKKHPEGKLINVSIDERAILLVPAMERLKKLGEKGLIVSIAYGEMKGKGLQFSVAAMSEDGQEFEDVYLARDFVHAIEIVETEALERGWIPN